jgi:hypothetical protein
MDQSDTALKTLEEHVNTLADWERNLLRTTGNIRDADDVGHQINTNNRYMVLTEARSMDTDCTVG